MQSKPDRAFIAQILAEFKRCPNPHDSLFRSTFELPEHAEGLIRFLLPSQLCDELDFNSLSLQNTSFVDQKLKNLHSDLLFSIDFRGHPAFVYILLEHQSSADAFIPLRMLAYQVRIWEKFIEEHPHSKKLPLILPLLVHHHPNDEPVCPDFEALYDLSPDVLAHVRDIAVRMHLMIDNLKRPNTKTSSPKNCCGNFMRCLRLGRP